MIFISLVLVVLLVLIDQAIKYFVITNIDLYETFYTLSINGHNLFSITHVRNNGAAWSIFAGKTILLTVIAVIAIILVLFLIASGRFKLKLEVVMLSFIMAGGIGNIIDRIKYKEVIDYIQTDFIDFPVFNFADICVVVGAIGFCVAYLIIESINNHKKRSVVMGALGDSPNEKNNDSEIDILTELSDVSDNDTESIKIDDSGENEDEKS